MKDMKIHYTRIFLTNYLAAVFLVLIYLLFFGLFKFTRKQSASNVIEIL